MMLLVILFSPGISRIRTSGLLLLNPKRYHWIPSVNKRTSDCKMLGVLKIHERILLEEEKQNIVSPLKGKHWSKRKLKGSKARKTFYS